MEEVDIETTEEEEDSMSGEKSKDRSRANGDSPSPIPSLFIEVGGKKRRLRFSFLEVARFERLTGLGFWKALGLLHDNETLKASDFSALLWAGLLVDDPDLTVDEVSSWLSLRVFNQIVDKVVEATLDMEVLKEGKSRRPEDPPSQGKS